VAICKTESFKLGSQTATSINHGFSTFATLSASGFFVYGLRRFAQLLLIVKYINWEIIYNNAISPICTTKFNLLISLENVYFQSKMWDKTKLMARLRTRLFIIIDRPYLWPTKKILLVALMQNSLSSSRVHSRSLDEITGTRLPELYNSNGRALKFTWLCCSFHLVLRQRPTLSLKSSVLRKRTRNGSITNDFRDFFTGLPFGNYRTHSD
jgi:hypothetical protein